METAPISDVGQGRFGGFDAVWAISGRTYIKIVHYIITISINVTPLGILGWMAMLGKMVS
jgi:hypothetical protein